MIVTFKLSKKNLISDNSKESNFFNFLCTIIVIVERFFNLDKPGSFYCFLKVVKTTRISVFYEIIAQKFINFGDTIDVNTC